jgi:hypothetical protein
MIILYTQQDAILKNRVTEFMYFGAEFGSLEGYVLFERQPTFP